MAASHDGPFCPRCSSFNVQNVERGDDSHNLCGDCGKKSTYVPTRDTIQREVDLLRDGRKPREDSRRIDMEKICRIQAFALGSNYHGDGRSVASEFGISYSSFQKIRDGILIGRFADWCPVCRVRITVQPCILCRARRRKIPERPIADGRVFKSMADKLDWPLSCVGIAGRLVNALERTGYLLVGHLVLATDDDLLAVGRTGPASIRQIDKALARHGLFRNGRR